MFEKLLSLLPYNPGLLDQLNFYSLRLREEASIRRTGLIFLILTFMVQFFAVISPPQPTVASGDNNMLSGGFSSAADAASKCRSNVRHYKEILAFYGISCQAVADAATLTIHSKGQDYYSMGWIAYHRDGSNETPVNIPGVGTLNLRKLSSFDTGANAASHLGSAYPGTLRVKSADDKIFYLLSGCGNLVAVGLPSPYTPPAPKPKPKPPVPQPKPKPKTTTQLCPYNAAIPATSPQCFQPCQYNQSIPSNSPQCFQPCPYNHAIPSGSLQCFQPCPYNNLIPIGDIQCKPCDKSVNSQDALACVSVRKTAANVTTGSSNADGTTANPGDVIVYTLYATNRGKAAIKGFAFQESLSDVMDYADVTDLHGGKLDNYNLASWPAETIQAGQTVQQQITTRVKNPVPATPADPTNPNHFDLVMTNVYGNAINIKVPSPPVKTVQTAAASLPNTGPGTSLFVIAGVVMTAGYFYGRSRLLSKESQLAVKAARV